MKVLMAIFLALFALQINAGNAESYGRIEMPFAEIAYLENEGGGETRLFVTWTSDGSTSSFETLDYIDYERFVPPTIEAKPETNSFVLHTGEAAGSTHWNKSVTISYRDERLIVSGFTFSHGEFNPSEDPDAEALLWKTCDVNLVTGDYSLTEAGETSKGQAKPEAMPLADNLADFFPEICGPFIGG